MVIHAPRVCCTSPCLGFLSISNFVYHYGKSHSVCSALLVFLKSNIIYCCAYHQENTVTTPLIRGVFLGIHICKYLLSLSGTICGHDNQCYHVNTDDLIRYIRADSVWILSLFLSFKIPFFKESVDHLTTVDQPWCLVTLLYVTEETLHVSPQKFCLIP